LNLDELEASFDEILAEELISDQLESVKEVLEKIYKAGSGGLSWLRGSLCRFCRSLGSLLEDDV
jgi:hypothetical protein